MCFSNVRNREGKPGNKMMSPENPGTSGPKRQGILPEGQGKPGSSGKEVTGGSFQPWVGWGGTISPGSARVTSLQDWALHSLHFLESIYPNNSRVVCPSFMVSSQSHSASLPISLSFLCVETPYILYPGFSRSMSHLFTDFQPSLPNGLKQRELRPKCVVK